MDFMIKATTKISPEISATTAEMETVFSEGMELERQGKLDEAAIKRIDARMKSISDRMDREAAAELAEISARYPVPEAYSLRTPVLLSKPLLFLVLGALVFAIAGVILELTVGSRFIFSHANAYRNAKPLMFIILIPILAKVWLPIFKGSDYISARYPTDAIRWLVMFPCTVVMLSTIIMVAPLGWLALGGWVVGESSDNLEAKIISIRSPDKTCKLIANLEIRGNRADICLGGRVIGSTPKVNDVIAVTGKISSFGVFIVEAHTK